MSFNGNRFCFDFYICISHITISDYYISIFVYINFNGLNTLFPLITMCRKWLNCKYPFILF